MKITVTTHHELVFAVEAFWSEEGGMGQDQYGDNVGTLEEAIVVLQSARTVRPEEPWTITVTVTTKVSKS